MIDSNNIYIETFEKYKAMGLDPVLIPYENGHPTKGPKINGWQVAAANQEFVAEDFAEPCNIGILLGGEKNLTDIDCDSPESVKIGGEIMGHLMERTGKTMMFGRTSKPRSHFIFYSDKSLPTERIVEDPANGRTFNRMMEERGYQRKQARVHGMSGKSWIGIRLKTHDELVSAIPQPDVVETKCPKMDIRRLHPHPGRESELLQMAG